MLKMLVSEPIRTERREPTVFVAKNSESFRFCIDHRKRNAVTLRELYPRPRMDKYFKSVLHASILSMLDLDSGHLHIEVEEAIERNGVYL